MMSRIRHAGFIRRPSLAEIETMAHRCLMSPTPNEVGELSENVNTMMALIEGIDDLELPPEIYKPTRRDPGRRPTEAEDPHNVFIRSCHVERTASGPLAGWRVALKDNIKVMGVPMTNGSRLLEGFVPEIDATVVDRLLDAGAIIVGKLNMDDWSFSGTGETSAFGTVLNPHDRRFSAGGSSSGAGAAVVLGLADLALGVDEGGSGRIPASWCGAVALKPTHGLISTFGLTYLEHTTDFICPTARSVAEVAAALEVLAGDDPKDPQFVRGAIPTAAYSKTLDRGLAGLKVGIVAEAIDSPALDDDVRAAFTSAARLLQAKGAEVGKVSVPYWRSARAIWNGFVVHGFFDMVESNLEAYGRTGYCDPVFQQAFGNARAAGGADFFPPVMKTLLITGLYLRERYKGTYFSKAANLRFHARRAMDAVLGAHDVLITPTTPTTAFELMDRAVGMTDVVRERASSMCENTYPTNVTGHPSLSVPCGRGRGGLPVGLQIVGPTFGEALVLAVGHAFESANGSWKDVG